MNIKKSKLIVLLLSITLGLIIFFTIVRPYRISGNCMEPAIKDGELYFINKLSPYFRKYKINDIIAFKYEDKDWIARIVALENNTIQINEGHIIVNGVNLQDNIVRNWSEWNYGSFAIEKPMTITKNHLYVLSDDLSAHHDDSRVFGPISESSIIGLIW